ncbi:MAG: CotH kinase family protein [Crocinitomicaceae bacterium]|nr:CotH kinase family protein [Crocinitomicaceae bacterium]
MKYFFLLLMFVSWIASFGQTFTDSDLPIIVITTENGVPIEDDPRVVAHMGIIDNGAGNRNYLSDPYNNYDGRIEIEIRGSTSQQYPKKGYGFETQDAAGFNAQVSLLGMPVENDWILYGPYPDKTMIRNTLTFDLAKKMGHYASNTRYCELLINGDYRGLYVAMERIKRDNDRVDIEDVHVANQWNDSLTGGYVIKVDKLTGEVGYTWESNYDNEVLFQFHDPEYSELSLAQSSYMEDFIGEFEDVIWGNSFNDPINGWPKYINVESFFDFFILQELGRTVDGYRSSSFMYKDKNTLSWNARLNAGPMWDFNLSFGNADYCDADLTTGWQYEFDDVCNFSTAIPFWWERLLDDPGYRNGLRCRWDELRQGPLHTDSILNFIDAQANYIEEARLRNFTRWPIIGTYVNWNGFVGQTYQQDLDYLKTYITDRAAWMDSNIPGNCNLATSLPEFEAEYHRAWPTPFENELHLGFSIFKAGEISIELIDLSGRVLINKSLGKLNEGAHISNFSGLELQSGQYIYRIFQDNHVLYTGKTIKK